MGRRAFIVSTLCAISASCFISGSGTHGLSGTWKWNWTTSTKPKSSSRGWKFRAAFVFWPNTLAPATRCQRLLEEEEGGKIQDCSHTFGHSRVPFHCCVSPSWRVSVGRSQVDGPLVELCPSPWIQVVEHGLENRSMVDSEAQRPGMNEIKGLGEIPTQSLVRWEALKVEVRQRPLPVWSQRIQCFPILKKLEIDCSDFAVSMSAS